MPKNILKKYDKEILIDFILRTRGGMTEDLNRLDFLLGECRIDKVQAQKEFICRKMNLLLNAEDIGLEKEYWRLSDEYDRLQKQWWKLHEKQMRLLEVLNPGIMGGKHESN